MTGKRPLGKRGGFVSPHDVHENRVQNEIDSNVFNGTKISVLFWKSQSNNNRFFNGRKITRSLKYPNELRSRLFRAVEFVSDKQLY